MSPLKLFSAFTADWLAAPQSSDAEQCRKEGWGDHEVSKPKCSLHGPKSTPKCNFGPKCSTLELKSKLIGAIMWFWLSSPHPPQEEELQVGGQDSSPHFGGRVIKICPSPVHHSPPSRGPTRRVDAWSFLFFSQFADPLSGQACRC